MQDYYWKKLEGCLSKDRLGAFGQDNAAYRTITARYLWNIALSESLYAPLHLLEVGLRNAINDAITAHTGVTNWYDTISLTPWGQTQIGSAKSSLARGRKPVTAGRVVAELHFGFWTSMFEDHYEQTSTGFLPKGIKATFPHMPKSHHNRKLIKADLDKIRTLRNRVFHYERIIHWKNLSMQHQLITQFLHWMSEDLAELATIIGTFDQVYADGIQPFIDKLDTHPSDSSNP